MFGTVADLTDGTVGAAADADDAMAIELSLSVNVVTPAFVDWAHPSGTLIE
jgi:hypothetical protein